MQKTIKMQVRDCFCEKNLYHREWVSCFASFIVNRQRKFNIFCFMLVSSTINLVVMCVNPHNDHENSTREDTYLSIGCKDKMFVNVCKYQVVDIVTTVWMKGLRRLTSFDTANGGSSRLMVTSASLQWVYTITAIMYQLSCK